MAKYRHIQTNFWIDPKVQDELTPEDRYFFLYLLTNPHTTQIGIYMITKKTMAFETGYSVETIDKLINRFRDNLHLIEYNETTREVILLNWSKYNLNKGGKPVLDCIKKELVSVKDTSFIQKMIHSIDSEPIKRLFLEEAQNRNEGNEVKNEGNEETSNLPQKTEETSNDKGSYDTSTIRTTIGGQKEKEKEKKDIPSSENEEGLKSSLKKPTYDDEFHQFWILYPRKVDKKDALKSFRSKCKEYGLETIIAGLNGYIAEIRKRGTLKEHIKYPSTFLNKESFLNYQEEETSSQIAPIQKMKPISQVTDYTFSEDDNLWND